MATKNINGVNVTLIPYIESTPGPQGAPSQFQSSVGGGASLPMDISFDKDIDSFSIIVYGVNNPNGYISALDLNKRELQRIDLQYNPDIRTGNWLQSRYDFIKNITYNFDAPIRYIKIVPPNADYIAFGNLQLTTSSVQPGPNDQTEPDPPVVVEGIYTYPISLDIKPFPNPASLKFSTKLLINSTIPTFGTASTFLDSTLKINPIALPIKQALTQLFNKQTSGKIDSFFDDDRVLKTVLNFGNDYQSLVTNWAYDPFDETKTTILFKLYQPLPRPIPIKTSLWVSRELSPPLIDQVFFVFIPGEGLKVYLRPPNTDIKINKLSGVSVDNVTEVTLYSTGAFDPVKPTDKVLEEWFVTSLEGSELNINYSDYTNFIWFSSAAARLEAFKTKLQLIENLTQILTNNSSSLSLTGSAHITGSAIYGALQRIADERLDLIKSFDGYERFLYYQTGSAYSSSFSKQLDDELFYHSDCTWPKISGTIAPITSASTWYDTQYAIAQEYDKWNVNYLSNNIPEYIKNDIESTSFIQFLNMVGHHFDALKVYIDSMTQIYDRSNDPTTGLSQDLIWNIAKSVGIELPNQYSLNTLANYTTGEIISKQYASETWKRFLHNHIFFAKTKGTKQALRALLNSYGVLSTGLQIRETVTPTLEFTSQSFEVVEENTTALSFTSGAWLEVTYPTTSISPTTVDIRFNTTTKNSQSIWEVASSQNLVIIPTTGSAGYIALYGGITPTGSLGIIATSSIMTNLFDGTFYGIEFAKQSGSSYTLRIGRAEAEDIVEFSEISIPSGTFGADPWKSSTGSLGGGTHVLQSGDSHSFGSNIGMFVGTIDEFRIWGGEFHSIETFNSWLKYPGLYNGTSSLSPRDNLLVRYSFNIPKNIGSSSVSDRYVKNESPRIRVYTSSSTLVSDNAKSFNFTDETTYPYNYDVLVREIVKYTPIGGGSQYDTNKVIISDAPQLQYISGSSVPVLQLNKSIVSVKEKIDDYPKSNNIIGLFFSPTDAVNDNIIRSLGNINLYDAIGNPADITNDHYSALSTLNKIYWDYYAYRLDANAFITYLNGLLGSLFEQAKMLVPARAKLLTGIVIEPTILERQKIPFTNPEVTAGTKTRNASDTYNLEANPITSHPTIITSSDNSLDAVYYSNDLVSPTASFGKYDTFITQSNIYSTTAVISSYTSSISKNNIYTFLAESPYYTGSILVEVSVARITSSYDSYEGLIKTEEDYRSVAKASVNASLVTGTLGSNNYQLLYVQPISDIDNDLGAREYFDNALGYIGVQTIIYTRQQQGILNDLGTWITGSIYTQNDMVVDSGTPNGNEYFVQNRETFISNLPPSLDPGHWRPVAYIPTETLEIKKVIVVSGTLSIAPTSSAYPFPVGYRSNHFSKTRDYRLGIIRHQYLGCVQDQNTTTDGKPPVETIPSTGDKLYVNNSRSPIQPTVDGGGPILDVR